MSNPQILQKFLTKIGVASYFDLNDEEKRTYQEWEESLSGRKLTDSDVSSFLDIEEDQTIAKLIQCESKTREDVFLKMKLDMIRRIKGFLASPTKEKQALEAMIINQVSKQ